MGNLDMWNMFWQWSLKEDLRQEIVRSRIDGIQADIANRQGLEAVRGEMEDVRSEVLPEGKAEEGASHGRGC